MLKHSQTRKLVQAASIALILFFWVRCSASAKMVSATILYDVKNQYMDHPPVVGLNVTFGQGDVGLWWDLTDGSGCVRFGSGVPDGAYWFNWRFGGIDYRENIEINCSQMTWHFNYEVPAKAV